MPKQPRAWRLAVALLPLALLGACAVAQTRPPPSRPVRDIAREEPGEVVTVHDTRIDLSTGRSRAMTTQSPRIPVGPVAVRVPLQIGGEKRVEVPAEEITVRLLGTGRLISVVQELSSPPFAPGERVRVLHERADEVTGIARTQIVRP